MFGVWTLHNHALYVCDLLTTLTFFCFSNFMFSATSQLLHYNFQAENIYPDQLRTYSIFHFLCRFLTKLELFLLILIGYDRYFHFIFHGIFCSRYIFLLAQSMYPWLLHRIGLVLNYSPAAHWGRPTDSPTPGKPSEYPVCLISLSTLLARHSPSYILNL